MPCFYDSPSMRKMTEREEFISLYRHHVALEKETEELRKIVADYHEALKQIAFQINIRLDTHQFAKEFEINFHKIPPKTIDWENRTYRNADGKFPIQTGRQKDWLEDKDYK